MNTRTFFESPFRGDILALIAGLLLPLAFAPFYFAPLAVISMSLLLACFIFTTERRAFFRGWLFGAAAFGVGVSWLYVSLRQFGEINMGVCLALTALFIAVLAVFPGLCGYFLQRFFKLNVLTKLLCAFPALWLLLEWIRGWFFSGFPWLSLGDSQTFSPLTGFVPVIGSTGVSLLILITAALLMIGVWRIKQRLRAVIIAIAVIWVLGAVLSFIPWTSQKGNAVRVSLVQGNVTQSLKWNPATILPTLALYKDLTEKHWDSQLIVWPETAIPIDQYSAATFLSQLSQEASQHHTAVITGLPMATESDPPQFYNSVMVLGNGHGTYDKRRLVPFGETSPRILFVDSIYRALHIPAPALIPGAAKQALLEADGLRIAAFICYEIAFAEQVRLFLEDADLILTVSDDTWFGHSFAPAQHLQMAQMRARETGRYVLFVGNSGITAIIDPQGHITAQAPTFTTTVLTGEVYAMQGHTPWLWVGDNLVLLISLIFLGIAARRQYLHRTRME